LKFNVPFQHKYGYIKDKVGGGELSLPSERRPAITSTLAAFLFSSHLKRERDREAHLNSGRRMMQGTNLGKVIIKCSREW